MRDLRINVGQIGLQVWDNEQEGEAIVFLHFSGANLMMWKRAVPAFQDAYRIVSIDLRGHGASDMSPTGYAVDDMASDVLHVMGSLEIDCAHVIGSSLGAEVGLRLAATAPERVISLVCEGAPCSEYGPYSTWEDSEEAFEAHVAGQLEKMRSTPDTAFSSINALVDARQGILQTYGWWNEDVEAMVRYGVRQNDHGTYAESFGRHAMASYMDDLFHARFEDHYQRVTCPVLLALGEDDLEDPREKAAIEGLCGLAKRGKIVQVPGWMHPYGWMLNPEPMCDVILQFLAGAELDQAGTDLRSKDSE